jgi:hypothetical protein
MELFESDGLELEVWSNGIQLRDTKTGDEFWLNQDDIMALGQATQWWMSAWSPVERGFGDGGGGV